MACLLLALVTSLEAQPTSTNHVLELDGTGGYVELPPNIFNDLTQATVEAWVRWDDFGDSLKRVFNYGDALHDMSITTLPSGTDFGELGFAVCDGPRRDVNWIQVPNILRVETWCHVAAVSGPGGMKLYLNGALAGTNAYTGSFAGLKNGNRFYFGQRVTTNDPPTNFKGAIDEVRVWKVARTGAQIRETMFRGLTGKEPGLAALWNFENVEGGVVKNSGPGAYHGKLIGSARILAEATPGSQGPDRPSKVLELDGTNSFVELPADAFTNLDEVTVEGWVKWESFGTMSRFFDFTLAGRSLSAMNRFTDPMLHVESFRGDDLTALQVPAILSLDKWTHIAVVAGAGGLSLFVDGALIATNATHSAFSATGLGKGNYLGRSNFKAAYTDADFHGQMDEVRVWRGARTEAQIRENMFRNLTGKEEGLAGLWSFEDGAARDASPAGHDGKLMGQARVVEAALPSAAALVPWSRLLLQATDAAGAPVRNVTIRAEVNGAEVGHATSDSRGFAPLTAWTSASAVDLVASSTNDLGGWQFGVPITPYTEHTNTWKLGPEIHLDGRAVALDGKTPYSALVIELVRPDEGGGNRGDQAPTEGQEPAAKAAAPEANRVLQLDGQGSYVALPPGIFQGLPGATVECWVKWDSFQDHGTHVFEFGGAPLWMASGPEKGDLMFLAFTRGQAKRVILRQVLHPNEWHHVAAVSGPPGMRFYLDGVLAGTNDYPGSFADFGNTGNNFLGACAARSPGPQPTDLQGQIAEFRVWKGQRTAEQIREDMGRKLTGKEPGLLGLWNFDDPTNPGRDASPGAHDGKLIGQATTTNAELPVVVSGKIMDAAGGLLGGASVEVHQPGREDRRIAANAAGEYAFTVLPAERCNIFVTTGKLSAYRLGFLPHGERMQVLDWTLAETQGATGARAVPARGTADVASAPENSTVPAPIEAAATGDRSRSLATNKALSLDGNGSFVELPPNIFNHLDEATVEAWVKWERLDDFQYFYSYGAAERDLFLGSFPRSSALVFGLRDPSGRIHNTAVPDAIIPGNWVHVAAVSGKSGTRLYVNGVLSATNGYAGSFLHLGNGSPHVIGSMNTLPGMRTQYFKGQVDELSVWSIAQTTEQIRENMGRKLTGKEPGLVGLWNFDDPASPGRDASPGGHDGKLIGQATVVPESLPVVVFGTIRDAGGNSLQEATVEVRQPGREMRRLAANGAGEYGFTTAPAEPLDLFVTTGKLSAYRLGFRTTSERVQELDWTLADTQTASGARAAPARSAGEGKATSENGNGATAIEAAVTGDRSRSVASQFPPGTVVARVLTDENGSFDFPNLKPGAYQLRAQVPGGANWFESGRVFFTSPDMPGTELARLKSIEFRLAPFKKGRWTKYTSLDGLPMNATGRTILDADGTQWIGCAMGLAHFDGRQFVNLTPEDGLPSLSAPLSLCRDQHGTFWVGTSEGLWRYNPADGQRPRELKELGLPTARVEEIIATPDGAVWWRTMQPQNLVRFKSERATVFTNLWHDTPFSWGAHFPQRLAVAADHLWLTGPGAGLVRFDGTNHVRFGRQQGLLSEDTGPVTVAPDGTLWLAVGTNGIARFDGTNFSYLTLLDGLPDGEVTAMHAAPGGELWMGLSRSGARSGSGDLVARFDGRAFTVFRSHEDLAGREDAYAGGICFDIQEGPDGALWFGAYNGVCRYERRTFAKYTAADGLRPGVVRDLLATGDGSLWLDNTNGITRFYGGRFTDYTGDDLTAALAALYREFTNTNTPPNGATHRAVMGPDGCLWFSLGQGQPGIERFDGTQPQPAITNFSGLPTNTVSCLTRAPDGAVWVGTVAGGVARFDGKLPAPTLTATNGLLTNAVRTILCGAPGTVWIGVAGGIVRYDGKNWTEFTQANGAPGRSVDAIEVGPDGTIWFGAADGGLSRFDGQTLARVPRGNQNLVPSLVERILRAPDGLLWFVTYRGVTRYDGITWSSVDEGDGLQPGYLSAIAQQTSGATWLGGDNGLTCYQPATTAPAPPRVVVQTDQPYTNLAALPEITAGRLITFKCDAVD
jgi:ligand-binding sensor domain-containing protein